MRTSEELKLYQELARVSLRGLYLQAMLDRLPWHSRGPLRKAIADLKKRAAAIQEELGIKDEEDEP